MPISSEMSLRFEERMRSYCSSAAYEVVRRFAWWPTRCPETRHWFWLRKVLIMRKPVVGWVVLSWGMGVLPYIKWKKVRVCH